MGSKNSFRHTSNDLISKVEIYNIQQLCFTKLVLLKKEQLWNNLALLTYQRPTAYSGYTTIYWEVIYIDLSTLIGYVKKNLKIKQHIRYGL